MMYNSIVRDAFFKPQHVGVLDLNNPMVVHVQGEQSVYGVINLYLQFNEEDLLEHMCFKTNGNPYVIAALERICNECEGQSLEQLQSFDYKKLVEILEIPVQYAPLVLYIEGLYKKCSYKTKVNL